MLPQPSSVVPPDSGLGTLINAVDVTIKPAPDGIARDRTRLERLAAALMAKRDVLGPAATM